MILLEYKTRDGLERHPAKTLTEIKAYCKGLSLFVSLPTIPNLYRKTVKKTFFKTLKEYIGSPEKHLYFYTDDDGVNVKRGIMRN